MLDSPISCSNSDDNLLKNIELFDRLSLSHNGRVLFIKDVIGDEICCWSFYGQGRKLAEVCCTSIVYATEKKQTKVSSKQHKQTNQILQCSNLLQVSLATVSAGPNIFGALQKTIQNTWTQLNKLFSMQALKL